MRLEYKDHFEKIDPDPEYFYEFMETEYQKYVNSYEDGLI